MINSKRRLAMIIGSCGYGATGSSVLTDLLREYDDVQVYDNFEFVLSYRVDGLEDLEYHLMKQYAKNLSGDFAIKRFIEMSKCYMTPFINKPCDGRRFHQLSKKFIDEITQVSYKGADTADMLSANPLRNIFAFASKKVIAPKIIEKIVGKPVYFWPCRTQYFSVEPSNFYDAARKYTSNILKEMGADLSKPICLDQPFEGNAPENSFKFFEDPYAIIVDRDPRDCFLAAKYSKDTNYKFMPRYDVDQFIVYYKNMRLHKTVHDRVLKMRFEDFVYNYEESVEKVEQFLHLKQHARKKQFFNPTRSINNTQLIRLHPEDKESISRIERELEEFLFPYEMYPNVKFGGRPFDGAARKAVEQ